MTGEPRFRSDLYRGTAAYYDRYRPAYPPALLDDLRARVPLDGGGRLLDLACGTGQVAFALAADVADVCAVDQEPETVDFARRKARQLATGNIRWITGSAEDVALDGRFRLVAIGNAFHRLDRDVVASRVARVLDDRGCVALLWSDMPTNGDRPWQRVLGERFEHWLDAVAARDRLPDGWADAMARDPHSRVLERAGLAYEGKFEFPTVEQWTVESLVGFVYSTSLLGRPVLGDRAAELERDLEERLLAVCPDGRFEQDATSAYELARRVP